MVTIGNFMDWKFLFLGTGASSGVPQIGCSCPVCKSQNPKNKRLRSSGLLQIKGRSLLIDVGPDFREQALCYALYPDGVLLTHTHYDHIAGIDELRVMNYRHKKAFPCLLSDESFADVKRRYYYLFQSDSSLETRAAKLDFQVLPSTGNTTEFLNVPLQYFHYFQAGMKVSGFRFGTFAYVSDIRDYDESIFDWLKGVQTLVLSALREGPSKVHFSFEEAVVFSRKANVQKTWLTHLCHDVEHEAASRLLPPDVQPAYDGLEVLHA